MNIKELKSKATASELTLINTITELVADEARHNILVLIAQFLDHDPPPNHIEYLNTPGEARDALKFWFRRLTNYLEDPNVKDKNN